MERKTDRIRGDKLKELRKNRGLTQQELGDFLGLSKQAISKFEQGIPYSYETAIKIAKFFNIELEVLIRNTKMGRLAKEAANEILLEKKIKDTIEELFKPRIDALEIRIQELENQIKD